MRDLTEIGLIADGGGVDRTELFEGVGGGGTGDEGEGGQGGEGGEVPAAGGVWGVGSGGAEGSGCRDRCLRCAGRLWDPSRGRDGRHGNNL